MHTSSNVLINHFTISIIHSRKLLLDRPFDKFHSPAHNTLARHVADSFQSSPTDKHSSTKRTHLYLFIHIYFSARSSQPTVFICTNKPLYVPWEIPACQNIWCSILHPVHKTCGFTVSPAFRQYQYHYNHNAAVHVLKNQLIFGAFFLWLIALSKNTSPIQTCHPLFWVSLPKKSSLFFTITFNC